MRALVHAMSSHLKEQAVYNTVCTQCKVFLLCMHRLRAVHDAGQRRADVCRAISVEDKVPDEGRVHAAVTLVASYGDFGGLGLNSLENHETTKPRNHETTKPGHSLKTTSRGPGHHRPNPATRHAGLSWWLCGIQGSAARQRDTRPRGLCAGSTRWRPSCAGRCVVIAHHTPA